MASSVYAVASVPFSLDSEQESAREVDTTANDNVAQRRGESLSNLPHRKIHKPTLILVTILFIVSSIFIAVGVTLDQKQRAAKPDTITGVDTSAALKTSHPSSSPTSSPSSNLSIAPSSEFEVALNLIFKDRLRLAEDAPVFTPGTDQWNAKRWMAHNDPMSLDPTDENDVLKIIQRFALSTIFYSMSGKDPMNVDWMEMDECHSEHISCDGDEIVRALEIGEGNDQLEGSLYNFKLHLSHTSTLLDNLVTTGGTIPDEIGLLSGLENLVIKNNILLGGTIPRSIEHLLELRQIGFFNNSLGGNLPDALFSLPLLTYLNLSDNFLTGRISTKIGQLASLEKLILDNNDFTGHLLPLELRKTKINVLSLSGNRFGAQIVPAMHFLHELEYLYLDRNDFVGQLPFELGQMTKLKSLSLSQNSFSGTLPSELGVLSELRYLNLAANRFDGEIPAVDWPKLKTLNLDDNAFNGTFPSTFSDLHNLGECI
jgi:hypothetical protein